MKLRERAILFGLVALNLLLKLCWLGVNDVSHDEPFTLYWSQQPLEAFWAMLRTENNPPLYFLLIKAWSSMVPFDAAWMRVPAAVASAATVVPLHLMALRMSGRRAAITASLLFTFSNYHFGFAHEVRAYALFTLLATTGMWLLWFSIATTKRGPNWVFGLSVVDLLMVYTHFFGWLAIAVQGACVLAIPELRPVRRVFIRAAVVVLIGFSPYGLIFLGRMGQSVAHGTWVPPPVPEELYNMLWRWSNAPVIAILFTLLIALASYFVRPHSPAFRTALIWSIAPLLGMFAISYIVPMFLDRYLVYAAPGFALLIALSIDLMPVGAKSRSGLAVLAIGGIAATFNPGAKSVRQPSRVVQAVEARCPQPCSLRITPSWYWLNYLAAEDLDQLKNDQSNLLTCGIRSPNGVTGRTALLVDATGSFGQARSLLAPEEGLAIIDSVEADHRVWVYWFGR